MNVVWDQIRYKYGCLKSGSIISENVNQSKNWILKQLHGDGQRMNRTTNRKEKEKEVMNTKTNVILDHIMLSTSFSLTVLSDKDSRHVLSDGQNHANKIVWNHLPEPDKLVYYTSRATQ